MALISAAGFDFCPGVRNEEKLVWLANYGKVGKQQRKKKILFGWPWTEASVKLKTHYVKRAKIIIAGNEITASSLRELFREINR